MANNFLDQKLQNRNLEASHDRSPAGTPAKSRSRGEVLFPPCLLGDCDAGEGERVVSFSFFGFSTFANIVSEAARISFGTLAFLLSIGSKLPAFSHRFLIRMAELAEEAFLPDRSSRSRLKSISRRPAQILCVTIGILLSVKGTKQKKAAVTAISVLFYMQRKTNDQIRDRRRMERQEKAPLPWCGMLGI